MNADTRMAIELTSEQFLGVGEENNFIPEGAGMADVPEYADVFTASAEYAARFDGTAGKYMLSIQEMAVAGMLLPYEASTLLDVGGGHGQLIDLYKRKGMSLILHGSSPVCFERLGPGQLAGVVCLVSPPHEIPLADKSIDVVVSVRLLSHMDQWPDFLGEMCRIARKAVVIDYPSTRSVNLLSPLLFGAKKNLEKNTRTYLCFSRKELHACFRKHGFANFRESPQFSLPMVVHRMSGGNVVVRGAEAVFKFSGLTALIGSPVILRATRH